jgi:hypothetical protein
VISRALLRYQFLPRPAGLSSGQADRAALLTAESRAPFPDAQAIVHRNVLGHGIWWWDAARLRILLKDRDVEPARLIPESAAFDVGEGWRQLVTREGYEAQCFRDLALVASQWRRRPFTPEQWAAFVESVGEGAEHAPATPPDPSSPSGSLKNAAGLSVVVAPQLWARIESAAVFLGAVGLAGALVFASQAFKYRSDVNAMSQAAAEARAIDVDDTVRARRDANLAMLQQVAGASSRPNPLLVGADAFQGLRSFNLTPRRWEVDGTQFRLELTDLGDVAIEDVAAMLERNPFIRDVRPQLDTMTGTAVFLAEVCQSIGEDGCGARTGAGTREPGPGSEPSDAQGLEAGGASAASDTGVVGAGPAAGDGAAPSLPQTAAPRSEGGTP